MLSMGSGTIFSMHCVLLFWLVGAYAEHSSLPDLLHAHMHIYRPGCAVLLDHFYFVNTILEESSHRSTSS